MKYSLYVMALSLFSSTVFWACQPTAPNQASSSLSAAEWSGLERDYAGFHTQALTQNYLQRKIEAWIQKNDDEAMRREIEFARIKHPDLLMAIMHAHPNLYTAAAGMGAVDSYRTHVAFDAYMVLLAGASPTPTPTVTPPPSLPEGMAFVSVPAGSFMMGQVGHTEPVHSVTLSAFEIQTTEVTQKQWFDIMGSWPGAAPNSTFGLGDHYPMYRVSWCDIVGDCGGVTVQDSFLGKLNAMGLGTYRLPTEAEWEYAARAGSTTDFACGNIVDFNGGANANNCPYNMGWLNENDTYGGAASGSKEVGTKLPNAWGLYDMHGNVAEWVNDWFDTYSGDAQTNPTGPSTGSQRVMRGGTWELSASFALSAGRDINNIYLMTSPADRLPTVGFRLVRAL